MSNTLGKCLETRAMWVAEPSGHCGTSFRIIPDLITWKAISRLLFWEHLLVRYSCWLLSWRYKYSLDFIYSNSNIIYEFTFKKAITALSGSCSVPQKSVMHVVCVWWLFFPKGGVLSWYLVKFQICFCISLLFIVSKIHKLL